LIARLRGSSRSVAREARAGTGALAELARLPPEEALDRLHSLKAGLEDEEANRRFRLSGPNRVLHEVHRTLIGELTARTINPLNLLLLALAIASYALGDPRAAIMIGVMVVLSTSLSFIREHRSNKAADALRKMVHTTATEMRQTKNTDRSHRVAVNSSDESKGAVWCTRT